MPFTSGVGINSWNAFALSFNSDGSSPFIFYRNPSSYDAPFKGQTEFSTIEIMEGYDAIQTPAYENVVRTMTWEQVSPQFVSTNSVSGIRQFAVRDNAGRIPYCYLYDGDIGEFSSWGAGARIQMLTVTATPIAGLNPLRYNCTVTFKRA